MRFTPSTNWAIAAKAATRLVRWTVEAKKTTSVSDALSSGTWVDITRMMDETYFPVGQRIEYSVGQFTSDSVNITAGFIGIPSIPSVSAVQFLRDNVFNASASQYIEVRVKGSIGISTTAMSSDTFYAFTGFVDKEKVQYSQLEDAVSFTVFTADEIGNRISALNINTQYLNYDIDGAGTTGLFLPAIPGVYVKTAAITSYELRVGLHSLEYDYNAGAERMRLDDGEWVALPGVDGTADLINPDGDQQLRVYVDVSEISDQSQTLKDYVIVTATGTVLPRQPYFGASLSFILRKVYEQVGVTGVTADTLQLDSWDALPHHSYYDVPPVDITVTGKIYSLANDGTDIYVGIGDSVYKRSMSGDSYTLVTTKTSYTVKRMWYNQRNGHLWIWFDGASNKYVRIYDPSGPSYVEVAVTSDAAYHAANLIDYNYSGASYKYGLVYVNKSAAGDVRIISSAASDTQLYSAVGLGYSGTDDGADSLYYVFVSGANVYFYTTDDLGNHLTSTGGLFQMHVNGSGTWVLDGGIFSFGAAIGFPYHHTGDEFNAVLNISESRIYYFTSGTASSIHSHTLASSADSTVGSDLDWRMSMLFYANGVVYASAIDTAQNYPSGVLMECSSNTVSATNADIGVPYTPYNAMTYMGGVLYGVDFLRRLYRYSDTLQMYIKHPAFDDTSVREVLTQCLQSYNLIGIISANKTAFIYRRGNDSGAIQTTGNTFELDSSNIVNIRKLEKTYPKVEWLSVTNGTTTVSYDGTNYNTKVLSSVRTMTLSNPLIPDEMVKHNAHYQFQFWNVDRDTYLVETNVANMEYEVMDAANITLSGTRVEKTGAGLIQAFSFDLFGNVNCEVLY